MKKNCKTCTLNTTNDTIETCKRMCYLRYSKQRNKRICDLEQEIQNLKQTLAEIKDIAEQISLPMGTGKSSNRVILANQILQKISEYEVENE